MPKKYTKIKVTPDQPTKELNSRIVVGDMPTHTHYWRFNKNINKRIYITCVALLIIITAGGGIYLFTQKNMNNTPTPILPTDAQIKASIQASIHEQQKNMPTAKDSTEQKKAFYESYFENLIAVDNTKTLLQVYSAKVAPENIYFNRDLQDQIAIILLSNGNQTLAKSIYIDSLAQAENELTTAESEQKSYIESEIRAYKSRIENL